MPKPKKKSRSQMNTHDWKCKDCTRHGTSGGLNFYWQMFSNGEYHIRMECAVCGKLIRYAPKTDYTLALANANPVKLGKNEQD